MAAMMALLLTACAASRRTVSSQPVLSDEDQRRYDSYYLEAVSQRQQGHYDVAFDLLQHCLTIDPMAPSARYELSTYYTYFNQKEKALSLMQDAVRGDSSNFWYQANLADAYCNNRDYERAIDIYEEMSHRFPRRAAELLPTLVALYQATEQWDKEIAAIDRMADRFGWSEEMEMEKFRAYWQKNDSVAAFASMEEMVAAHPDDVRYRLMMGDVCINYDQTARARAIYASVLKDDPGNDMAYLGVATCYEKEGDSRRAQAIVDSVVVNGHLSDELRLRSISKLVSAMVARGDTLAITDLFDRVLATPQQSSAVASACAAYYISAQKPAAMVIPLLEKVLSVEPDNKDALKQLLYYAVQDNDTEQVSYRSKALLAYWPDELYAYYYMVITALRADDDALARNWCEQGITHIGKDSDTGLCTDLWALYGDLCFNAGEDARGYEAYDSALVYNPSSVSVLNNYAYNLSLENRDLDHAEEMSRVTITKEPTNSTYLDTYAWILFYMERYDEARLYAEQALQADTTSSSVLMEHAGDIYWKCGQTDEALQCWREALTRLQLEKAAKGGKPTSEERLAEDKLKKKIRLKKWIP